MKKSEKSQATRFSDHFHKVRLTSITLSISLFLSTLHQDGVSVLQALPVKLPPAEIPFILVCFALAATVSFAHTWMIWSNEAKDIDASLQPAGKMIDEVRELTDLCKSSISHLKTSNAAISERVLEITSTVRGLRLTLLDSGYFKNKLIVNLNTSDHDNIIRAINEELGDFYFGAPHEEAIQQLTTAVSDSLIEQGLPSPSSLIYSAIYKSLKPATPAGQALLTPQSFETLRWQGTEITGAIGAFLSRYTEDAISLVREGETHGAELRRRVDAVEQQVRDHFEADKAEIRPQLEKLNNQLKAALTLLTRSGRTTKVIFYGFDLAVPAAVFIVGLAHAAGRVFGPVMPSASHVTSSVLARLAEIGWWAEALAFTLFLGSVVGLVLWSQYPAAGRRGRKALHRLKNLLVRHQGSSRIPESSSEPREADEYAPLPR